MSYHIGVHSYTGSYRERKVSYINKYDKSLKIPFITALHNQLQILNPAHSSEPDVDENEVEVSDIVELSSAVVGMSDIGTQA